MEMNPYSQGQVFWMASLDEEWHEWHCMITQCLNSMCLYKTTDQIMTGVNELSFIDRMFTIFLISKTVKLGNVYLSVVAFNMSTTYFVHSNQTGRGFNIFSE